MANKQTRQLRELSRKTKDPRITLFTRTTYGAWPQSAGKRHVVEILSHEHSGWAFNPERAKTKNKRRYQKPNSGRATTSLIG